MTITKMTKGSMAQKLLMQTDLAYEISFIDDIGRQVEVGWSNDTGLYGSYDDDLGEPAYQLACCIESQIIYIKLT